MAASVKTFTRPFVMPVMTWLLVAWLGTGTFTLEWPGLDWFAGQRLTKLGADVRSAVTLRTTADAEAGTPTAVRSTVRVSPAA